MSSSHVERQHAPSEIHDKLMERTQICQELQNQLLVVQESRNREREENENVTNLLRQQLREQRDRLENISFDGKLTYYDFTHMQGVKKECHDFIIPLRD